MILFLKLVVLKRCSVPRILGWVEGHEIERTSLCWPDICVNWTSWNLNHRAFHLLGLNFGAAAIGVNSSELSLFCWGFSACLQLEGPLSCEFSFPSRCTGLQDFPKHCKSKAFARLCWLKMEMIPMVRWSC